jgi:hypothetical protein
MSVQVFSVAPKIKKMPAEIKKGIIGKYPRMITASNIQDVGRPENELARKLRFPLIQKVYVEHLADTRSM